MRKRRVVGRIYGMKYSWKGHKDRNTTQEQNKKEWARSVGLCQKPETATSPPREGEPTGTLCASCMGAWRVRALFVV